MGGVGFFPGVGCQGGWRSFTIARKKIERYKGGLNCHPINSEVKMRFCLIDEITELEPGRQINAVKSVSMAEEYLSDHFPGFPVLPGVFMLEAIVQTSAWLIRVTDDFAHSTVLLKESRSIKFPSFVEPGNQLMLSALIMDQMVSSIGIHGKAFFLDCLSLKYELLDLPLNWKFCLVDSQVQRNLRDSSYNERYNQLKKAEKDLGVEYLGSVKIENFSENKFSDPIVFKRAKHVITENKRVLDAKKYLLENNIEKFGQLMNESHSSYSKDFEASTDDVDIITQRSIESGALGSRLTGGGFGGFTVSLMKENIYDQWYNSMKKYYSEDKFFEV